MINVDIQRSSWIDALGHVVQLRRNAIPELLVHLENVVTGESNVSEPVYHLFRTLVRYACQMGFGSTYRGSRYSGHWKTVAGIFH